MRYNMESSSSKLDIKRKFMKLLNIGSHRTFEPDRNNPLFKVITDKKHRIVNQIADIENKLNYLN